MSSLSNSVTLLLSSSKSARSWTASLLAIPLQLHQWKFQQCHAPVQAVASPLQGKHHLSHNKGLLWARSIPPPTLSTSMGRQPHAAMQGSHNPVRFYRNKHCLSRPGPQQYLKPLCQTFPSLRLSNLVSIKSVCSCPGPSSSPKSATTPTGYGCHWTAQGQPAQHHGWHLLQQIGIGYPSSHGISAIQFTVSYQCTQHGNDIATMAKVIANVPLKLQQKIIQDEFIDLSELLQADFHLNTPLQILTMLLSWYTKMRLSSCGLERRASRLTA